VLPISTFTGSKKDYQLYSLTKYVKERWGVGNSQITTSNNSNVVINNTAEKKKEKPIVGKSSNGGSAGTVDVRETIA
jgi:hypothetical protein